MNVVAVGIGGFFGAIARYTIGEWIHTANGFPLATLVINLLGCLFLSWFFTMSTRGWHIHPNLKWGIGTGFTGAFTTFSTFSVETLHLITHHQYVMALLYVLLSILGGIGLAILGAKLGSI